MDSNYRHIIENAYKLTRPLKDHGKLATYIPELANVNPAKFGVHMTKVDGTNFGIGDNLEKFSIQSSAKVLSLIEFDLVSSCTILTNKKSLEFSFKT